MAAQRKYGDRETYNKIRAAQARVKKLEKSGVIKAGASSGPVRINRYGEAHFESRAVREALSKFAGAFTGTNYIRKLTPKAAAQLKAQYADLSPENQPTIKNNSILLTKGVTVRSRSGKAQIERKETRRSYANTFLLKSGWQEKIRKAAERNPGKSFRWEFVGNGERTLGYGFPTTEYGVEKLIQKISSYTQSPGKGDMSGVAIRLVLEDRYFKQHDERRDNVKKAKAVSAKKRKEYNAIVKKDNARRERDRERQAKRRANIKEKNKSKIK